MLPSLVFFADFSILNEWMNEWSIYIALYCVLLYTQSTLQSCGGGGVSPQPPPLCSIHLDDATAATAQRRQCAHHTPATGGEEREIEPIKWMGIIGRPWLTRTSGGNLVSWQLSISKVSQSINLLSISCLGETIELLKRSHLCFFFPMRV